jgi:integrase
LKPIDLLKYQNWLLRAGMYSSAIKMKRSAISALNDYIILYYGDEFPLFRNYVTKGVKIPETGKVSIKVPLTDQEYKQVCDCLEDNKEWQKLAYVKFAYSSGARKNECRQLTKDIVNYPPVSKEVTVSDEHGNKSVVLIKKYKTNLIKCKGKAQDPMRRLSFDEDAMFYIQRWLSIRGEDNCPFVFVTIKNDGISGVSESLFNSWCNEFGELINRHIYPHLFRSSRATNLAVSGKSLESIRNLLGHKSSETTRLYIVKDDGDEEDEAFV